MLLALPIGHSRISHNFHPLLAKPGAHQRMPDLLELVLCGCLYACVSGVCPHP